MRSRYFTALVLATAVSAGTLIAQTATDHTKAAGRETSAAAKDTGHAVAKGTKTGYRKTKSGTKTAARATAHGTGVAAASTARGTKRLGKKIIGDKTPTTTPHNPQ